MHLSACRNVLVMYCCTQTCRTSGFLEQIPGEQCLSLPMCRFTANTHAPMHTHAHACTRTFTHSIPVGSACHQACSQCSITSFHWDNNCDFLRIDLHQLTSVTLHMGMCVCAARGSEQQQQCVLVHVCVWVCCTVCVGLPFSADSSVSGFLMALMGQAFNCKSLSFPLSVLILPSFCPPHLLQRLISSPLSPLCSRLPLADSH